MSDEPITRVPITPELWLLREWVQDRMVEADQDGFSGEHAAFSLTRDRIDLMFDPADLADWLDSCSYT